MANESPEATVLTELAGYRKLAQDWVDGNSSEPPESLTTWQALDLITSYDSLRTAAEAAIKVLGMEFPGSIKRKAAIDQLRAALHPQQEQEGK